MLAEEGRVAAATDGTHATRHGRRIVLAPPYTLHMGTEAISWIALGAALASALGSIAAAVFTRKQASEARQANAIAMEQAEVSRRAVQQAQQANDIAAEQTRIADAQRDIADKALEEARRSADVSARSLAMTEQANRLALRLASEYRSYGEGRKALFFKIYNDSAFAVTVEACGFAVPDGGRKIEMNRMVSGEKPPFEIAARSHVERIYGPSALARYGPQDLPFADRLFVRLSTGEQFEDASKSVQDLLSDVRLARISPRES